MRLPALILLIALPAAAGTWEDVTDAPSIEDLAGQVIIAGSRGLVIAENNRFEELLCSIKVGGIILFDKDMPSGGGTRNIESARQLSRLTASLQELADDCGNGPLLIAADVEGGRVNRLGKVLGFRSKSHARLGRLDKPRKTLAEAKRIGKRLKKFGINWDLAPVVDVNINPDNPAVGKVGRSFSDDPAKVVIHAESFIRGLRAHGILSCLKHFPGLGSATTDPHYHSVDVTDTAEVEIELLPYKQLISNGMADAIMTTHLYNADLDDKYLATISPAIINGILREEMGFTGVVVSDDLQMAGIKTKSIPKAAVLALRAGTDMIIISNNLKVYQPEMARRVRDGIVDAVKSGKLSLDRLEDAVSHIDALKERLN